MRTLEILKQIEQLPVYEHILIIEKIIKSIREKEIRAEMSKAVEELKVEYKSNSELIAFTDIDFESFYEPR